MRDQKKDQKRFPTTVLGQSLVQQTRQAVPDDLDGWPAIYRRLQTEKPPLAVASTNKLPPIVEFTAQSGPARPQRGWVLAGLSLVAGLALLVVVGAALLSNNPTRPGLNPRVTLASSTLSINQTLASVNLSPPPASASVGQGKLAFIKKDNLMVLDGATGKTTEVSHMQGIGSILQMGWSYKGQWLAYITQPYPDKKTGSEPSLWLTRLDGKPPREIPGFAAFEWSPVAEEMSLLITARANNGGNLGAWFTTPTGNPYPLIGGVFPSLAHWSPDGSQFALIVTFDLTKNSNRNISPTPLIFVDALDVISKNGRKATEYYRAKNGDGLKIIGWWPNGQGLLFQTLPSRSASVSMDGLPVENLNLTTKQTSRLITNLVHADWIGWLPDGEHLFAIESGSREDWSNKTLELCDTQLTTTPCQPITLSAGKIPLELDVSSDGKHLAFVQADKVSEPYQSTGLNTQQMNIWNNSRTLWLTDSTGQNSRQLNAAGTYIQSPQWSRDGQKILYEQGGGLWLLDLTKNQPTRLAEALYESNAAFPPAGYYGYQSARFAWYQP